MSSVTQTIPSYTGGLSQQPDELKVPGQVKTAKNVLPDVTEGLMKRPGSQLIGSLMDESDGNKALNSDHVGKWFHYYRDENEQYIGQIARDGDVNMWGRDGSTKTVHVAAKPWLANTAYTVGQKVTNNSNVYKCSTAGTSAGSGGPTAGSGTGIVDNSAKWDFVAALSGLQTSITSYLTNTSDEDLQTVTLNDYTYITNRTKTVAMAGTTEAVRPPEAYLQLKKVSYAAQYAVNLFDDPSATLKEIKSVTRVKVASTSLDNASTCPNVTTEILKIGTDNQDLTNVKQKFTFTSVTIGNSSANNFFEDDATRTYSLIYVPPAWAVDTYYQTGDLVQGESDDSRIYKRTGSALTSSGSVPSHDSGETDGWTALTTTTYTANSDVASTQLYNGQACIEMSDSREVDSSSDLNATIAAWAAGNGAHFPFEIDSTTWDGVNATLNYIWKTDGDYSEHLNRIIFRRSTGTNHTVGGNNVPSATDGALITNNGSIRISRIGWGVHNVLGAGRSGLYFRLTTTGQAVPIGAGTGDYQCRYTTVIDLLHGGDGWEPGDKIQIKVKEGVYVLEVEETSVSKVQANLGLIRPIPTSFDAKTVVTSESILGDLRVNILGSNNGGSNTLYQWKDDEGNGYHCKQIGSGLYLSRPTAQGTFNANSPFSDILNVVTDSIKDIAELPNQCKHGYVVKVANSDAEEDDYYVKFFGHNDRDGEGVWEECAKPGTSIEYDSSTLPIQIKRESNGSFTVSRITWEQAQVGDTAVGGTNPRASFVGNTINKLLFFRNRFVMLSDENVIMSRPGNFTNFWNKSAIQFTNTDPIDVSCSSEYPAIVYDGIQVNAGLVLFTKNQQFMLTTDSDVLSPLTAKINAISSYNFNYKTNPFSLGTTIGFLDNAGKHSRFLEMARVLREGEPDVIEQSKIISKLLDKDLDLVSNSRENGLVFFSEKNKTTLYGFKYFNASDKRLQQSWFTWEFKNKIVHHAVLDDDLYVVTANSKYVTGQRVSRTSNTLTLTNHGLAQGDAIKWYNGGTALVAGGVQITDGTTLYVSVVPDSNTFKIANSAANAALGTVSVLSAGNNATQNIHYTSNKNVLQKIPLKLHTDSITVTDDKTTDDTTDDVIYKIHLDNMTTVASSSLAAYDATNDQTTFTLPTDFNLTSHLSAYVVPTSTDDTLQGLCQDVTITRVPGATSSTWTVNLPGNWKTYVDASGNTQTPTNNIILGQKYDYEVKLPTIYYQTQVNESYRSDRRGSLVLHRLKLNFGNSGLYETLIERTGKPDYSEIWEPTLADNYLANQVIFEEEITRTVPIYDRNSNTSITIKSSHPSPATLYSMTWEGDYSKRFYTSV